MSAFIVDDAHIDALISFAILKQVRFAHFDSRCGLTVIDTENADGMGRLLLAENVRSVHHRYGESGVGAAMEMESRVESYRYTIWPLTDPLSAVQILKACACFDYQACETSDYEESAAWRLIQAIRQRAIAALPGYDQAQWEIRERPADRGARPISLSTH